MKAVLKPFIVFWLLFPVLIRGYAQKIRDSTLIIYFKSNSYAIDTAEQTELNSFLLKAKSIIRITGYADSTGSNKHNKILSQKRADGVASKIKETHIQIKEKPIYKGEGFQQDPDLSKNRKVEIKGTIPVPVEDVGQKNIIKSFDLENIYFVPDMATITDESLPYINELANRLKQYKTESFEIIGHVNYQSKKDSSQLHDLYWLSERRAKTIYNILIEKGIPANRMTYRGVGNSQPLFPDPVNDEEKRKNMRVQVIIRPGS